MVATRAVFKLSGDPSPQPGPPAGRRRHGRHTDSRSFCVDCSSSLLVWHWNQIVRPPDGVCSVAAERRLGPRQLEPSRWPQYAVTASHGTPSSSNKYSVNNRNRTAAAGPQSGHLTDDCVSSAPATLVVSVAWNAVPAAERNLNSRGYNARFRRT